LSAISVLFGVYVFQTEHPNYLQPQISKTEITIKYSFPILHIAHNNADVTQAGKKWQIYK